MTRNPFVAEATPGVDVSLYIERGLAARPAPGARRFVQLLGERGAGKTTLMLHWRREAGGSYSYVARGWRRWGLPAVAALCFWDEADRLPGWVLRAALRLAAWRRATVVVGTHVDLGALALRAGLAVETVRFPALEAGEVQAWARLRCR